MLHQAQIEIESRKPFGSKRLATVVKRVRDGLVPLRLNVESDLDSFGSPWRTSQTSGRTVSLRQNRDGLEVRLSQPQSEPFYIVHNSSPRHFKKLQFAEGVATAELGVLQVGVFGRNDPTLSCSIVIIEFDERNERIGSFAAPLNTTTTYTPSSNAWRSVVFMQFKGTGRCTVFGVRLAALQPSCAAADRAETSATVDLKGHDWLSADNIFVRYGDALKKIKEEADKLSAEIYKWKRRALGWEKQAQAASAGSQIGAFAYNVLLELAKSIPVSNGSRYHRKIPLKVGVITDIYMYNYYKDVFEEVRYLSPTNYDLIMSTMSLDLILYVTCWKGIENEEWRGVKFRERPAKALDEIIERARKTGAKLVFQSIEDPSNFEYFLPIAKKFDYVFTSDTESIARYKTECGHERVFYGEYGANPLLNNPIGCRRHVLNAAFFAGSWTTRYKERCEDMETIFDSIQSAGGRLVIADRNHGTESPELKYPERFRGGVMPAVEHGLLQSMHKLFRYNLNFNSIKNSPTMCAMRVYEMQAMGIGIRSNYARSVFNNFPEMRIVPWREDLTADFEPEAGFDEYRRNMALVRNVLNDRTANDITVRMMNAVGFEDIRLNKPVVCVICDAESSAVRVNFDRQRYEPRVLAVASDIETPEEWAVFSEENEIAYFTWFTGADEYEENYLDDLVNAFKYTAANFVTRAAWFDGTAFQQGIQHDYTREMAGKARTLFAADAFSPLEFMDRAPHEPVGDLPGGYAIDPFELNYRRFLERTNTAMPARPSRLSVIVPVFNNGRFVRAKCVESLQRNRAWPEMEVLLIDDGSTDPETLQIVQNIAREHSNVRTFFFGDGGSGSASRPRNKGIELATAPLIAFLDPDNEISPGGYDVLLALYDEASEREGGVDFVSGYHVKVEDRAKAIGKHASQRLLVLDNLKVRFLESGKFPVIPTQPAVISRRLFESEDLRFVEKSAGQDTLFGWELLCQSRVGAFTDAAYLIYYAQRAGSIVNAIDATYFEKKLILEQAQTAMLLRHGLMDAYLQHHYDRFLRDWYLPKLEMVESETERRRCAGMLAEIAAMYGRTTPAPIMPEMT